VPGEILPAGVALVDAKTDQKRQGLAILMRLYRYKQVEVGGEIN
jgi:hypothetical protein